MRGGWMSGVLVLVLVACGERDVVVADREGEAGEGGSHEGGSRNGSGGAAGSVGGGGTGGSGGRGGGTQTGGTGTGLTGGSAGDMPGSAGDGTSGGSGADSGGAGGRVGTTAGGGGTAGEAGAGASGGAVERDCATIVAEYGEVLREASSCNPELSVRQCTLIVDANTGCDCKTFANPENVDALQRLEELAREVTRCERPCPAACLPTARGVCGSGTADYGLCYGTN